MPSPPQATSLSPAVERSWIRAALPHVCVTLFIFAFAVHVHFRTEYVLLTLFWAGLTVAGPRSRRFANIAVPVLCVGVLYDQILPQLLPYRGEVHVADVFHLDLALFGVNTPDGRILLSEWFQRHNTPILDFLCGFGYITYMFETFIVCAILYVLRDEERALRAAWAFLICNIIGFSIWMVMPASPPWYAMKYGLGPALQDVMPSAAGAARFDALIGYPFFAGFYLKSHNTHGAMPSLHAAYPAVVMFAVWTRGAAWRWPAVAFAALVALAAVYLDHHYVIDVIAGIATAGLGYAIVWWFRESQSRSRSARVTTA